MFTKKLLVSCLLVSALLVSSLGVVAFAEGESEYVIGVSIWSDSGPLSTKVIKNLRHAGDVLDTKIEVSVDGFVPEKQINNVENFIARGVDGVMICNCTDAVVPKIVQKCDKAEIPIALYFRKIYDEKARNFAHQSDYFVGNCHENEEKVGYNLGKMIADNDNENAVIINYDRGDTTAEARYRGYKKAFEEYGVNLLGEQWDVLTADKGADAMERFIAAYPELDAVAIGGGGGGPIAGAVSAIKKHNKIGEIDVTGSDFGPSLLKNIKEGEVLAMSGGHWTDPLFTFMMVWNEIDGHPLSSEPATLTMTPLFIDSPQQVEKYQEYCVESYPYNEQEIKNMTVRHNPDFTLDDLRDIVNSYSLTNVEKRHS